MNRNNVIEMEVKKEGNAIQRKAKVISEIVGGSIAVTLDSKNAWNDAIVIGGLRGLYKWDAKSGLKTGAVVMGAHIGINVVANLARNIKQINEA